MAYALFYVIFVSVLVIAITPSSGVMIKASVVTVGLAYSLVAATLCYRVFAHARLTADPTGLTIANPFRGNQHLAWDDIATMQADRLLIIHATNGAKCIAWVVQKNGWSRYRHQRTDADDAIDELALLAGRALGTGPKNFGRVVVSAVETNT